MSSNKPVNRRFFGTVGIIAILWGMLFGVYGAMAAEDSSEQSAETTVVQVSTAPTATTGAEERPVRSAIDTSVVTEVESADGAAETENSLEEEAEELTEEAFSVGAHYLGFPETTTTTTTTVVRAPSPVAPSPVSPSGESSTPSTTTTVTPTTVPGAAATDFPWQLSAPSVGISATVKGGTDSNSVVDAGHIWHWPGTGTPEQFSHMVVFAHRTSKGGVFRHIHELQMGDKITVTGPTGKVWTYSVAGSKVVSPSNSDIYGAATESGGPSISLVACSKADGTPTSLSYRLVVTAVLD